MVMRITELQENVAWEEGWRSHSPTWGSGFCSLFQLSIPALSHLQSWAAVVQLPEPADFRCDRNLRKISETRPGILLWTPSDQDCHRLLGLEGKYQSPGEGPDRNPSHFDRSSC